MLKRSISIAGHRTSVALEPEFWDSLSRMASERSISLPELIAAIDGERLSPNLSSSLRVAVLNWALDKQAS